MYGTTDEVKKRSGVEYDDLNVDDSVDLDEFIEKQLGYASDHINVYCQRDFEFHEDETEKYSGNGQDTIALRNFPVVDVSSVEVNGSEIDEDAYRIEGGTSYSRENSGVLKRVDGDVWRQGVLNIVVTYTWGYESVPDVVNDIAVEMAVDALKSAVNNYKTGGLDSMSIEGFQTKFTDRHTLDESQRGRLRPFKKAVFA